MIVLIKKANRLHYIQIDIFRLFNFSYLYSFFWYFAMDLQIRKHTQIGIFIWPSVQIRFFTRVAKSFNTNHKSFILNP